MELKGEFLLRVASSFIDEVSQTKFYELVKSLNDGHGDPIVKAHNMLVDKLNLAVELCDKAKQQDLNANIDGVSSDEIKSIVYFEFGNIFFAEGGVTKGYYESAVEYYEKSLSLSPNNQQTYFNLGQTFLRIKGFRVDKTPEAITAFQKCIEINPDSDIAISAGKTLARLGKL